MKKINSRGNSPKLLTVISMAVAAIFGLASCERCELDDTMPQWLGSSIYECLVDSGYTTYANLIEDLGYTEVLSKTGSKTLFVADEEAVERFYESGIFKKADGTRVESYKDLSLAQKKMLLYGAMLNNVYQVAMLSSTEGTPPTKGDCMRRVSSSSVWDTVPFMKPEVMPNNKYWEWYRKNGKALRCLNDETDKPMVFFTEKFLTMKKITNDDYDFLFNQGQYAKGTGKPGREPGDASINGIKIARQNQKCLNGFIHIMEDVIYPLPNMAEYLNINKQTQIYSALLERFCAPYFQFGTLNDDGKNMTNEFNRLYPDNPVDTLWQKRYFSKRSHSGTSSAELETDAYGRSVNGTLKFDPAWSSYYSATSSTTTANVALQQNMGVMLVPDDVAMTEWWNNGGGKPLKDRYGRTAGPVSGSAAVIEDMLDVPDNVIVKLLNNNMLNSFTSSVPSKFENVLDDANDPMGIETSNIDSVKMCCNGAIYFTNYVFSPTAYRSVSFPTLVNESLQIINWAIEHKEFDAYLNSMVARYSFFVPMARYIPGISEQVGDHDVLAYMDPVGEGEKYTQLFAFYYDATALEDSRVKAEIFTTDTLGNVISRKSEATSDQILDRLEDLLDYHIVIGDVEDGYEFYQTKGRGTVKVDMNKKMVYGGRQIELGQGLSFAGEGRVYDMTKDNGNGRTYLIDAPLATSYNSVYDIVSDSKKYPQFSTFFSLMGNLFETERNQHALGGININTFNTYHYTVYIPTNASLQPMVENGEIPNYDKLRDLETYYEELQDDSMKYVTAMIRLSKALRTDVVSKLRAESKYADCKIWKESDPKYSQFWNEAKAALDAVTTVPEDETYVHQNYVHEKQGTTEAGLLDKQLTNFVKYHLQDNSVYVGGEFKLDTIHVSDRYAHYETAYMNERAQFEKLAVRSTRSNEIFIIDATGKEHHVMTSDPNYYNIMCREYEYNKQSRPDQLETSSFAVIHMIDSPLDNGSEFTYYKF